MASYAKAGCENPAKSSTSPVIPNRQTMPGVQMPGSRTRKSPGPAKTGELQGEANMVAITHGKSSPGKQTWKGAREGYTTKSIPDYKPSPARDTFQDTKPLMTGSRPTKTGEYSGRNVHLNGSLKPYKDGPKQSVKGKDGSRRAEAKSVAGQREANSRR